MEYKGYKIVVEVDVNEQWEFEETDKGIRLTSFIDNGGADESGIVDYIILDKDGDYPEELKEDFYGNLADAKEAIDNYLKENK